MSYTQRKCFVICPYGDADGDPAEKKLFQLINDVLEKIVQPACDRATQLGAPIEFVLGRDIPRTEDLWEKIRTDIANADGILCIIVGLKENSDDSDKTLEFCWPSPNTFIELGFAAGVWHEPILLKLKSLEKPSDISGLEHVDFTLSQLDGTDSNGRDACIAALTQHFVNLPEKADRKTPDHLPDTTSSDGQLRTYRRFSKAIKPEEWSEVLELAEQKIIVATPKMWRIKDQGFKRLRDGKWIDTKLENILLLKALAGVQVTVVFSHPDNFSFAQMKRSNADHDPDLEFLEIDKDQQAEEMKELRHTLFKSWEYWAKIKLNYLNNARRAGLPENGFSVIRLEERYLPLRLTLTEKRLLATQRLYTERFNSGLCIDASNSPKEKSDYETPIYDQIASEIEFLIAENEEASSEDFETWRKQREG